MPMYVMCICLVAHVWYVLMNLYVVFYFLSLCVCMISGESTGAIFVGDVSVHCVLCVLVFFA